MAYKEETQVRPGRSRAEDLVDEGLFLRRQILLVKGATRIRVVMFDRNTGRLGSLEFPLQ